MGPYVLRQCTPYVSEQQGRSVHVTRSLHVLRPLRGHAELSLLRYGLCTDFVDLGMLI